LRHTLYPGLPWCNEDVSPGIAFLIVHSISSVYLLADEQQSQFVGYVLFIRQPNFISL
jgi:hypothetical protein